MTPEEQKAFDDVKQQVANLTEAFRTFLAFRDNHLVWLKETGVYDVLVQDVLSRVPPVLQGAKGDKGDKGDPGVSTSSAPVSSSPVTSDFASQVLSVLRTSDVRFDGKVGFGQDPIQDTDARITLRGGQILGTNVGNWQNPGAVIENIFDIANSDGGIRALQYVRYFEGKPIRSAPTRPVDPADLSKGYEPNPSSIFAIFDSHGDTCVSDSRVPYGQVCYLVKSPSSGTVTLATYQPNTKLQLRESSAYGAADIPVQP